MGNTVSKQGYNKDECANENPIFSTNIKKSSVKGLFPFKVPSGDKEGTRTKFRFMSRQYRWSKIYRGKTGSVDEKWFVYYSFLNPFTLKYDRFKVYEGINYFENLEEKESYALELSKEIDQQLKSGYDPFKVEQVAQDFLLEKQTEKIIRNQKDDPCISDGFIQFMHQKVDKNRSKQTIQSYTSYLAKFDAYLISIGRANMKVSELTTDFIVGMMKWIEKEYTIGNTTYNNHIAFLYLILNWFSKKPRVWINMNEFSFGTDTELEKKTSRPERHTYFTDAAMQRIKKFMDLNPSLLFYAKFIYYSCMRPDEIRNLKIENIDLEAKIIRIIGKTDHRVVPICTELSEMIESKNISNYPMTHYLIGKGGEVNSVMHAENYYSAIFRDLRVKSGLSDKFTLYGLKHTRVIHLSAAGYRDAEIMQLTGHTSTESYDKYKRDLMGNLDSKLKGETIKW